MDIERAAGVTVDAVDVELERLRAEVDKFRPLQFLVFLPDSTTPAIPVAAFQYLDQALPWANKHYWGRYVIGERR